jgi:hypothetical protein
LHAWTAPRAFITDDYDIPRPNLVIQNGNHGLLLALIDARRTGMSSDVSSDAADLDHGSFGS